MSGRPGTTRSTFEIVDVDGNTIYHCYSKPEAYRVLALLSSMVDGDFSIIIRLRVPGKSGKSDSGFLCV